MPGQVQPKMDAWLHKKRKLEQILGVHRHDKCVEQGCEKFCRSKSDKCKAHGGGKRCVVEGCGKSARDKTDKCKAHGGGKRCVVEGCGKSARDKTDKCVEHGGGKRCVVEGCGKSAVGKTDKCIDHGGGKRCVVEGCGKSAVGKTDKCVEHGGGKRCVVEGCGKSAQGKTDKCIEHGGGKRCVVEGCGKSARGKTDKCVEHGGGLRCPNCIDWPDSRSGKRYYDGHCATCFKHLWPNDERSKLNFEHTKELVVRSFLDTHFEDFVHDKPLHTAHCDCSHRRRVDHRRVIGNTLLCVETDEHHHRGYDPEDEQARYHDVIVAWGGKLCFVRFNPDGHGPPLEERLERLHAEVTRHIGRLERGENTAYLEVWHLYYPAGTQDY